MENICPVCQKDDLVQRVETLVAAGQSSGTYSGPSVGTTYSDGKFGTVGGYTTLSGSTSSNLAKLLEPPSSPPKPKGYGCWWILIAYPVIPIVGSFFSIPFMIPGGIILGIAASRNQHAATSPLGGFGIALIMIGAIIGIGLAIRYFVRRDRQKKAIMQQELNEAMPTWEKAMNLWKRLYYCHRDGIVYDPDSDHTCVPSEVQDFVYKQL